MTEPKRAYCKSCTDPVFWADTDTGKSMLVNAEPVPSGNLRLTMREGRAPLATVVKPHLRFGVTLYVSHFSTCAGAREHRRAKRGAA